MDEYQGNSYKARETKILPQPEEKKKVEKAIEGEVVVLKSNGFRKIVNMVLTGSLEEVGPYILKDVVVPALQKTALDMIVKGGEMLIYGKDGCPNNSTDNAVKVSYRTYYNGNNNRNRLPSGNGVCDYDRILFNNRGEAEAVLASLREQLASYGLVSIADFYDAVGIVGEYTTHKFGWKNLDSARVIRTRDSYILKLPPAKPLD